MKIQDIVNEQPPAVKPRIKPKPGPTQATQNTQQTPLQTTSKPSAWQTAKDFGAAAASQLKQATKDTTASSLGHGAVSAATGAADWLNQVVSGNIQRPLHSLSQEERRAVQTIGDPRALMQAWNSFVQSGQTPTPALEKAIRDILAAIEKSKRQ